MNGDRLYITPKNNPALSLPQDARFAPKLSFEQRCFALCLRLEGASWPAIAAYFNVHRRTMEAIEKGPAYKNVRDTYYHLGKDAFVEKYLDKDLMDNYLKFLKTDAVKDSTKSTGKQGDDPSLPNWYANPTAKGRAGENRVRNVVTGEPTTVSIDWQDSRGIDLKPGWYWSIPGEDGDPRPYSTSALALDASKRIWDPANTPEAKQAAARLENVDQLNARAAKARAAMEADTNQRTVDAFVAAARATWTAARAEDWLQDERLKDKTTWRDVDPTPFGHVLTHDDGVPITPEKED